MPAVTLEIWRVTTHGGERPNSDEVRMNDAGADLAIVPRVGDYIDREDGTALLVREVRLKEDPRTAEIDDGRAVRVRCVEFVEAVPR